MRFLTSTAALAAVLAAAPLASAQNAARVPTIIPLQQSSVPQMNPAAGRAFVANPAQLTPGASGVPSSSVYAPPFYRNGVSYANYPGAFYFNNNNNPYGNPAGGFSGFAPNSSQFYAIMGGPASSNPFAGNVAPVTPTWGSGSGVSPTGQPWNYPFQYYNFNNTPQYPYMVNAPIVGQSNGFFPNQQPTLSPAGQPTNFGVQSLPGLNGLGNPR